MLEAHLDRMERKTRPVEPSVQADRVAHAVIGSAIEVHRHLGPGLLESIDESALCVELGRNGMRVERQKPFPVVYKGVPLGEYRPDLIVDQLVVVEVKSVERLDPVFEAQVLTYLRIAGKQVGLPLNVNSNPLGRGIKRLVLTC